MTKYLKTSLVLLLSIGLLASCESEESKEFVGFFLGFVVFLIGTLGLGLPAVILAVVSINTTKKQIPIYAIILTVLYVIFLLFEINMFSQSPTGMNDVIVIFPVITVVIILLSIAFIMIGINRRKTGYTSKGDGRDNVLDNVNNSEDDKDLI